ncbi:nose resistant to fluoxetine protein 6 [Cephus cinctus]|uniref:Nose resistant to fluoxetine protein 6 n=1 Tax=Cephus cinctus TaxID=211228 RepID=A0AAJ7C1X7_CEPCN|nr:nose resistant to fluoxetine protein 6 [Cephus cinctus]
MSNVKQIVSNCVFVIILFLPQAFTVDPINVLKIDAPLVIKNVNEDLVYDTYNENMLPLLSRDLSLMSQAIEMIDDSSCRDQCKLMLNGLHNLTSWAVKFYDASGKFPEGVLGGSVYQLGNFDECLEIGNVKEEETPSGLRGQYCLGEVNIDVPNIYLEKDGSIWEYFRKAKERYQDTITKLHWGICVPAACAPQDVEDVIRRVLAVAFSGSRLKLTPRIPENSCYTRKPLNADSLDVIYLCILLCITAAMIAGTIFHWLYLRNDEEVPKRTLPQVMLAFSVISNFKKLCGPCHNDGLNLECISGIKCVAMFMIVAGHTLIFVVSGPVLNRIFWEEAVSKVQNSVFLNNPLLVDTFLLLSGFLMSRLLLRELDKRGHVNFIFLYIFRYIRLTPVYMVMLGLYMTWLPKLDKGPLWYRMDLEKERCLSSWWTNLLYVNNYVNTDNLCMFQSWYLSVDTQLFILAPIVVYPLWRWRRPGEFILAGVTTLSMLIPFTVTLLNNLDPTFMIYTSEIKDISTNEYFRGSYIKTHMRASSYCFGIIFGYVVYRIQIAELKLSKNTIKIGWFLGSLSLLISMYSISVFYGPRKNFTTIEAAIYSSLHRAMWSLGTGWVLVACITDNAGPVKTFLTWKPLTPISRLTYSAYLINGLIELHNVATIRSPEYLNNFSLFKEILAHITLTFGGAVILSTMFESPILALEKTLLRRGQEAVSSKKINIDTNSTTEA